MCCLSAFYKIKTQGRPKYLYKLIRAKSSSYHSCNSDHIEAYYCRTCIIFKYSFFPYTIVKRNRLDHPLHNSKSCNIFKTLPLKTGRSMPKPTINVRNHLGLKLLTRLRLGLSHLNEDMFNHNFEDDINLLCSCSLEVESTTHFFLHCHNFVNIRNTLLNKLKSISCDISNCSDRSLTKLILYGNPKFSFQQNSGTIH